MKLVFALTLSIALLSCPAGDKKLTLEEQIYESLFHAVMQDAVTEIYISSNFDYHLLTDVNVETLLEKYPRIDQFPADMLDSLISQSKTSGAHAWEPIMVNGKIIDPTNVGKDVDSYYFVSRPVIDKSSMEAVISFGYKCVSPLCGAQFIAYLKKSESEWEVVSTVRLWVS